ncbi:cryptochrome/photolyase family protein [Dictyobacter aurantiacus]|uniref:Cryptochrome/photolyase family protein n=1 Tax=Dictyobacter aurantiacus TaxID=1936993 RepID=A0A401ZMS5_9CHLR|nr:cryptochrome/photolyase family protein [Dictyobacter aurantiacus]GCE08066.1 cryptochrome/photolyase family protein [Dictyobacter aurantiacus]
MKKQVVSVWIPGDQLLLDHPALREAEKDYPREDIYVVLIESRERICQLPYQRKKIVLLLSAMRHYAERLRVRGYQVELLRSDSFISGLLDHVRRQQPVRLLTMAASEYDTRQLQQKRLAAELGVSVAVLPNSQFLIEFYNPIPRPQPGKRYVMEHFYHAMRRHYGILLDDNGEPTGGQWNYDKLNRQGLPAHLHVPAIPTFQPDAITRDVIGLVESMDHGVGSARDFDLAVTHEQAQHLLKTFIAERLTDFGPYEDAMSSQSSSLYHSQLSPYINIGLLDPLDAVQAAEVAYYQHRAPIQSVEGFVRQILGWREFMYWQYWQQMPGLRHANSWHGHRRMPQMFWDGLTDMKCVQHIARRVLDTGYSNHIERLMVICNFCLLSGIDPYEVSNWFLSCYVDAYDWVVLPNVVGMGMNSDDGYTATKPYIASANYINKMSDYCNGCRYSCKQRSGPDACPFNVLYWNFLIEHEQTLRSNPRMGPSVLGLRHLDLQERKEITEDARQFLSHLAYYPATDSVPGP